MSLRNEWILYYRFSTILARMTDFTREKGRLSMPLQHLNGIRNQRKRRVELLSGMQGRITLPKPGDRSTRNKYHNVPVDHPPPPSLITALTDHHYYEVFCNSFPLIRGYKVSHIFIYVPHSLI